MIDKVMIETDRETRRQRDKEKGYQLQNILKVLNIK